MSRPESVSSRIASARLEHGHVEDLVALLLAAREPFVDRALQHRLVHLQAACAFSLMNVMKSMASSLLESLLLAPRVERGLQEIGVVDAGNLDRILERHEHAFARALVGRHVEQILALVAAPRRR